MSNYGIQLREKQKIDFHPLEFKAPNPALVNLSVSGALDFKQHLATGSSSERAENSSERAG